MALLHLSPVLEPLLEIPVAADLHGREPAASREYPLPERRVHTEDLGGRGHVSEEVGEDLHVHGRAGADHGSRADPGVDLVVESLLTGPPRVVLRRHRGVRDEPPALGVAHQEVQEELGGPLHDRVHLFQELPVPREEVVLPEVGAQPGASGREGSPVGAIHRRRDAPEIGVLVLDPAARTVVLPRDLAALVGQLLDHPDERLRELAEVRHFGGPVVHLQVDVGRVLRVPRRVLVLVPDALEVRRLRAGPRRGDQQVARELEAQRRQSGVVGAVERLETLVGRQPRARPSPAEDRETRRKAFRCSRTWAARIAA